MGTVWQYGSQRLHREVDFHFALLALLRSFLFSVPLVAFASISWLIRSHLVWAWWGVPIYAILWAMCWVAHNRQLKLYLDCEREAVRLTEAIATKDFPCLTGAADS
jgi:hypothetical protein